MMQTTTRGNRHLSLARRMRKAPANRGEAGATGLEESSGVLPPLGEFEPTDPSFELFDPCTEIPDETLQNMGVGELEGDVVRESGFSLCTYSLNETSQRSGVVGFSSSIRTPEDEQLLELKKSDSDKKQLPVEFVKNELFDDMFCTGGVRTERGYITVSHSGYGFESSLQEKCSKVEQIIAEIL